MSEVFQTNEIAYRSCILYEAVRRTPVKKAYENMKEILFKTPTFENCFFYDKKDENREDLEVLIDRVMGAHDAYNPHTKIYRIENTNDYVQISIVGPRSELLDIRRFRS
ncbi:hypothetical protein CAEBREN_03978 [Caenorhabditis brenneri]|uniref:Uncharacterized protein n=1 Tax=Caenorhabditis brenneri TaxID=135651 RepID=G0PMI9_CAEBE|nr:hypothetical protein CAEBREN_03978 [Caenorhabditis brenneri]